MTIDPTDKVCPICINPEWYDFHIKYCTKDEQENES